MRRSRPALPHRRGGRGGRPLSPAAGGDMAVDRPRGQFLGDQLHFYHPARRRQQQVPRASAARHVNGHARNTTPSSEQGNHRALNVNGVLNRPPQSKPEDRGNAFESRVARSSARSAASAETEAPPLGGPQCGRREPMGVTTWETSFVVYTELRLDAYESNATRGVIKMITHAATGCSKWDSASL